jgi:hypothetical protein
MMGIRKWVLSILGAILIGAFGSGLWQHVLHPLLWSAFKFALDVGTLGIETFKDEIYQQIAQGYHAEESLLLLRMTTSTLVGVLGFAIGAVTAFIIFKLKKRVPEETKLLPFLSSRFFLYGFIIFLIGVSSYLIIAGARIEYINKGITHFNQCKTIVSPYISEQNRLELQSKFAMIRNRKDYVYLLDNMEQIANKNKVPLPTFKVW